MSLECVYCGSKDNLQTHHWAYGDKEQEKKCAIKLCDDCWRYQTFMDESIDEYDDEVEEWED